MGWKHTYTRDTNKDRRIATKKSRAGRLVTELVRNDEDFNVIVSTDERLGTTKLKIVDNRGKTIRFSGRRARTIYRVLERHFNRW